MKHPEVNREFLINEYVNKKRSIRKISQETGCHHQAVKRRLLFFGIPINRSFIEDITGKRFGRWFVEARAENDVHGKSRWLVKCDCGVTSVVTGYCLLGGYSASCNSCKYKVKGKHHNWKGFGEIPQSYWYRVGNGSNRRKKIALEISIEYAWNLFLKQERKCALTGLPLMFGKNRKTTASLDRIDSAKGYIDSNVQWIHKTVNKMKNDLTVEEFVDFCCAVAKHYNSDEKHENKTNDCLPLPR